VNKAAHFQKLQTRRNKTMLILLVKISSKLSKSQQPKKIKVKNKPQLLTKRRQSRLQEKDQKHLLMNKHQLKTRRL
jgi:hypothetical protein